MLEFTHAKSLHYLSSIPCWMIMNRLCLPKSLEQIPRLRRQLDALQKLISLKAPTYRILWYFKVGFWTWAVVAALKIIACFEKFGYLASSRRELTKFSYFSPHFIYINNILLMNKHEHTISLLLSNWSFLHNWFIDLLCWCSEGRIATILKSCGWVLYRANKRPHSYEPN